MDGFDLQADYEKSVLQKAKEESKRLGQWKGDRLCDRFVAILDQSVKCIKGQKMDADTRKAAVEDLAMLIEKTEKVQ